MPLDQGKRCSRDMIQLVHCVIAKPEGSLMLCAMQLNACGVPVVVVSC